MQAATAARENGASWSVANGIFDRGRTKLIESAQAMGLTKAQAKALADQILKTPDKTAKLKGNMEDLAAKLKTAKERLAKVPDSRKAKVRAEISDLNAKIAEARRQLDNLDGKVATTYVSTIITTTRKSVHEVVGATGGLFTGTGFKHRGYAHGGLVDGPGTGTSDSVFAPFLSKNEFVVNAKQTAKHLPLLKAINSGGLGMAAGGMAGPLPVGTARTGTGGATVVNYNYNLNLTNRGVISSKQEFRDYLIRELDTLRRLNKLPTATRGG
jgi:hypothetical protein